MKLIIKEKRGKNISIMYDGTKVETALFQWMIELKDKSFDNLYIVNMNGIAFDIKKTITLNQCKDMLLQLESNPIQQQLLYNYHNDIIIFNSDSIVKKLNDYVVKYRLQELDLTNSIKLLRLDPNRDPFDVNPQTVNKSDASIAEELDVDYSTWQPEQLISEIIKLKDEVATLTNVANQLGHHVRETAKRTVELEEDKIDLQYQLSHKSDSEKTLSEFVTENFGEYLIQPLSTLQLTYQLLQSASQPDSYFNYITKGNLHNQVKLINQITKLSIENSNKGLY